MRSAVARWAAAAAATAAAGCAAVPMTPPSDMVRRDHTFAESRDIGGTLRLAGSCLVPRGVTLTVLPGTRILFLSEDKDGDGMGDGKLVVEGKLICLGEPLRPVIVSSAGDRGGLRQPGDWEAIIFNFSSGNVIKSTILEYARHTIHAHFSEGIIRGSVIRRNYEGCRLGSSRFTFEGNAVINNESKGLNFRSCANVVRGNTIRDNGNGIFIFESDNGSVIEKNNIFNNERYNLRLDDFFQGTLSTGLNWWGSADETVVRKTIYDSRLDADVGTAVIYPAVQPFDEPEPIIVPEHPGGESP